MHASLDCPRSLVLTLLLGACASESTIPPDPQAAPPVVTTPARPGSDELVDVLALREAPAGPDEPLPDVMADLGSWFAASLPPADAATAQLVGPWLVDERRWAGPSLMRVAVVEGGEPLPQENPRSWATPGGLHLEWTVDAALSVRVELRFVASDVAMVRATVHNELATPREIGIRWSGTSFTPGLRVRQGAVVLERADEPNLVLTSPGGTPASEPNGHRIDLPPAPLPAGETRSVDLLVRRGTTPLPTDLDAAWDQAAARWIRYLEGVRARGPRALPAAADRRLAAKAAMTLVSNWRHGEAGLKHDGLFPSLAYPGFHGFWAWDSWKHAVALVHLDPDLARDQVRAMFALQRSDGMVPDVIYRDDAENNWRDTKPPLSAWAVWTLEKVAPDRTFLEEMRPRLEAYHAWWYRDRDHDGDGLCEYGSTDGTLRAAAWESGMDNAVRFDGAAMKRNRKGAHSMDRESVDLNAYLVAEKRFLANIAESLGDADGATRHRKDAEALARRVSTELWSGASGWFHDRKLDGALVEARGPEGFTPVWAGVATPDQAQRARDVIVDPKHFGTHAPFPTLDASHAKLEPDRGYWRGPVWLDQAYFGISGLRRNGFGADADALTDRLLDNVEGLRADGPIRETYNPLTGAGQNAHHFSWSAAHVLMLLWERADAGPS